MENTTNGSSTAAISSNGSNGSKQQTNGFLKINLPVQFHNGTAKQCIHCDAEMPNLKNAVRPKEAKTVCVTCNRIKEVQSRTPWAPADAKAKAWAKKIA